MRPEVGKVYFRKNPGRPRATVIEVVAADEEWVRYRVLRGPNALLRKKVNRCKRKNFAAGGWQECRRRDDYHHLDGCKIFATFLVLGVAGDPLFRCSEKRARHYLKKGYVREAVEGRLQFTNDVTEKRLEELYRGEFSEFFVAVKNDRCCVCGRASNLTRHHVVPTRHKAKMPARWRCCISNILFVCGGCHERYEAAPEPEVPAGLDWLDYARLWRDHFLAVMRPEHLPPGWDIVSVKNLDSVEVPDEEGGAPAG
jgi:hypothetical protein